MGKRENTGGRNLENIKERINSPEDGKRAEYQAADDGAETGGRHE